MGGMEKWQFYFRLANHNPEIGYWRSINKKIMSFCNFAISLNIKRLGVGSSTGWVDGFFSD
jgi:hypothetical protein